MIKMSHPRLCTVMKYVSHYRLGSCGHLSMTLFRWDSEVQTWHWSISIASYVVGERVLWSHAHLVRSSRPKSIHLLIQTAPITRVSQVSRSWDFLHLHLQVPINNNHQGPGIEERFTFYLAFWRWDRPSGTGWLSLSWQERNPDRLQNTLQLILSER